MFVRRRARTLKPGKVTLVLFCLYMRMGQIDGRETFKEKAVRG